MPSLRGWRPYHACLEVFGQCCDRDGFRLVEYSVQSNHLHLLVEGDDRTAVSRGLQRLKSMLARKLNKLFGRRGKLWSDRYHDRVLRTLREVRNALLYVLANFKKHCSAGIDPRHPDPCSSGPWFGGWIEDVAPPGVPCPVAQAQSWRMIEGWLRHGLLSLREAPA